jgi:outer membrane receptor for ferrienterochelin and colicins
MPYLVLNPACSADRRKVCEVFASARNAMMKILFFAYFAVSFQFSPAQSVIIQLKDKVSDTPVEFAYVSFRQMNGRVLDKQITDIRGEVKLNVALPAIVEISCIGYKNATDTVKVTGTLSISLSPDYYQLDQVVVTGQFRPQPADKSIYRIAVIDSKQFQLKAANNMGDLLKNELSFQYRSEGVLGDFIRIHGLSGEYVKILIDGMPVTGRVADRIDLGQLTLNNVDHVEVIEGPMSVIYGSSALAGAINIITADYSGKKLQAQADAYYETVGTYNVNTSFSTGKGYHTFTMNAGRNFFSGWGPSDTSREMIWKPKLQYVTGLGYQIHRNKLKASLNSDFMHEELRDPGALTLDSVYSALDGYHYTNRWNNRANFVNTFNDDFVLNLQASYSYYQKRKITYQNDLVNLKKWIASNPELHDTTTFQMISARGFVSNIPGKKYEYQTGFDLNYESAHGKRTGGYRSISDVSGFMNLVYRPFPILSLQPGIRLMHNSNYKSPLVYAFNVKLNPAPFVLRASYARGFRAPSLKQLYLEFIDNNHHIFGNENLKAETADNISVSLNYDITRNRHALNLETDLFYNAIENAIQLAIDLQHYGYGKYFNVTDGKYRTKGAEAKLGYRFSPSFDLKAGIIATGRSRLDAKDQFSYSTDWESSATFRIEKYKMQMALFYKYTDAYLDFAGNYDASGQLNGVSQQYMAGYHMLDFTAVKELFQDRLSLSAGCKNIFNVTLVNSFGSIDPHNSGEGGGAAGYGRTFFMQLAYRFSKN